MDDVLFEPEKSDFCKAVDKEAAHARTKHGPVRSFHEGLAVIWEEFDEFKAEVWKQDNQRNHANMLTELIQIAAMCKKTAEDCKLI